MNSEQLGGGIRPPDDPKLHHIGFVVSSIEQSAESFIQALGASWDGKITFDPVQKVRVSFFQGRNSADPLIELVEPGESESPVSRFLERGGGLHHLCYDVENLDAHLAFCKSVGTIIIRPPVPAVAFDGRRIAWGISKKKLLLEFLESGRRSQ
jgi:methylmalonyl-CoA/ethylmalonyl-CoA epimerase